MLKLLRPGKGTMNLFHYIITNFELQQSHNKDYDRSLHVPINTVGLQNQL